MHPHRISLRDWLAVITLSSILLTLGLISFLSRESAYVENSNQVHHLKIIENIEVTVQGAVRYPGVYSMQKGDAFAKLLGRVEPLPDADLQKYKPGARLNKDRVITIPHKGLITVYLEGAVKKPESIQLNCGTRICDLAALGVLLEEADKKFVKKRKKLKDGEIINVPYAKNYCMY